MSQEKKSWDEIPSLEGLEMDWEYKPESPLGKRAHQRLQKNQLMNLLEVNDVPVKVAAGKTSSIGSLLDLSVGGFALNVGLRLAKEQPFRVGFFLGKEKIVANARVRRVGNLGSSFRIGASFEDLDRRSARTISDLYPALILKQSL